MRRWLVCMATLGVIALVASPVKAELYYGFTVGTSKAPPAPVFRYSTPPAEVLASDAMVYVITDVDPRYVGDLFRYGQYWFAYTRGFWYRARDLSGPYSVIDVRNVPRAVIYVPRKHWKHHPKGRAPLAARPATVATSGRTQVVTLKPAHAAAKPKVVASARPGNVATAKPSGPAPAKPKVVAKSVAQGTPSLAKPVAKDAKVAAKKDAKVAAKAVSKNSSKSVSKHDADKKAKDRLKKIAKEKKKEAARAKEAAKEAAESARAKEAPKAAASKSQTQGG